MRERVWHFVTAAYLVLCLVLGGASAAGAIANALLQIVALGLIIALLWTRKPTILPPEARTLLWIAGALVVIVLLSLVPLPPSWWQALPMRDGIARSLNLIGVQEIWATLSLAPFSSIASLLALLPPLAMFLLVLHLPPDARRVLPAVVLVVALISIALGVFQLMGGVRSSLRFYEITNEDSAVGFFANRNHHATLLLCALPLVGFLAARLVSRRKGRTKRSGGAIISIAAGVFITIGVALIGSEAGYGLFLPAAFASALIYQRAAVGRLSLRWVGSLAVIAVLFLAIAIAGPLGQQSLSGKFSTNPTSRRVIAATTAEAIRDSVPVGTGLGTFAQVYRRYEDPGRAAREYVNHAHNDYIEVTLELGLPGALLIFAFILWWARRSVHVWRNEFTGAGLARAGSIIVGIVLLHSLVDYPLRTAAIAALVAAACGLLVPYSAPFARRAAAKSSDESLRHLEAE